MNGVRPGGGAGVSRAPPSAPPPEGWDVGLRASQAQANRTGQCAAQ